MNLKALPGVRQVLDFLGPVETAIAENLNVAELARIAITVLVAGGGIGGVLQELSTHVPDFVSPGWVAFASAFITLIIEGRRRLAHGDPGTFTPAVIPFKFLGPRPRVPS